MRFFRNPPRPRPETGNGDAGARETRAEKPRGALRAREVFEAKREEPERVSVPRECAVGDSANTPFSSATFRASGGRLWMGRNPKSIHLSSFSS